MTVSCSKNKAIKIWDAIDYTKTMSLPGNKALFSPSGNKIITIHSAFTATLWNAQTLQALTTEKPLILQGHTNRINSAVFNSAEDKVLTISKDKTALLWNALTGTVLVTFKGHEKTIISGAFNDSEDQIVTTSKDHTAKIWDAKKGTLLVTLGIASTLKDMNLYFFTWALFNKTDDHLITLSTRRTLELWDISSVKQIELDKAEFLNKGTKELDCCLQ
ncbi:hypothetical protein H0X06_02325 [Candidatus Dependentiae bacterium]|nr:hypothetical protein [Candidatus Dependentiae bacterium]